MDRPVKLAFFARDTATISSLSLGGYETEIAKMASRCLIPSAVRGEAVNYVQSK